MHYTQSYTPLHDIHTQYIHIIYICTDNDKVHKKGSVSQQNNKNSILITCIFISRPQEIVVNECHCQFRLNLFRIRMRTALLLQIVFFALSECQNVPGTELGEFQNTQHGVSGQVYKVDDNTIKIENFNYDGTGNETFVQLNLTYIITN